MGFIAPHWSNATMNTSGNGTATTIPPGARSGDLLLLLLNTQSGSSPLIPVVPSGGGVWTLKGSQTAAWAPLGGVQAVYTNTYTLGDTPPTLSRSAMWIMLAIRSDTMNAAGLLSGMTDSGNAGGSDGSITFNAFGGVDGDLRIAWIVGDGNSPGIVSVPAATKDANNQWGNGFGQAGFQASGGTWGTIAYTSIWPDSNLDANPSAWTQSGALPRWLSRQFVFHDGSNRNGWTSDKIEPWEAIVPIFATTIDTNAQQKDEVTVWVT